MCKIEHWKQKVAESILNDKKTQIQGYKLKVSKIPETLYRYRAIGTVESLEWVIDTIKNGGLWCSKNTKLNDPFEFRSTMTSTKSADYLNSKTMDRADCIARLKKEGKDTSRLENASDDEWLYEYIKADMPEAAEVISEDILKCIMEEQLMELLERNQKNIYNITSDVLRVACFSERYNNVPMWAHYTTDHEGVCLEYAKSSLNDCIKARLYPVVYVDVLPDIHQLFGDKVDKIDNSAMAILAQYVCIHKLLDWSYEEEWRMLQTIDDCSGDGTHIAFPAPTGLILGCNISPANKERLLDVAEKNKTNISEMKVTSRGLVKDSILEF